MCDPITVSMCIIKERYPNLEKSVPVLARQCDRMFIYQNSPEPYPVFLNKIKNVTVVPFTENGGPAAAWATCQKIDGYHLVVDDDWLYPEGYVERMVGTVVEFDNRIMACVFGFILHPIEQVIVWFRFYQDEVDELVRVLIPGGGGTCWHTSAFRILPEDTDDCLIVDEVLAIKTAEANVPVYAVPRPEGWLKRLDEGGKSIGSIPGRDDMAFGMLANYADLLMPVFWKCGPVNRREAKE